MATLKRRFYELYEQWKSETGPTSSTEIMCSRPSYRAIINLGPDVVPIILEELQHRPDHWFIALQELTSDNPVPEEDAGDIVKMSEAWVNWGKQHGVL